MPDTPHAKEVASSLLGACLRPGKDSTDAAFEMKDHLEAAHFYDPDHKRVAAAIFQVLEEGDSPDQIAVTEKLREMGQLEAVGGAMYVTNLSTNAGLPSNAKRYALIVKEKRIRRLLIDFGDRAKQKAYDDTEDALEVLEAAQSGILEIGQAGSGGNGDVESAAEEQMQRHIESARQRRSGKNPIQGVRTGWDDIDKMTSGFEDQEYIVIAARPSMGKTAWAINAALNAINDGNSIAFFSLEMGKKELLDRMAGCLARLDMQKIKQGWATDAELQRMVKAMKMIKNFPIKIIDDPGITSGEFRAKSRRLVRNEGVDMIIVDYLQLFEGSGDGDTREQEVSQISRQMKITAKELDVPVVALSQLNRKPMNRGGGKRPKVSDLRESGAIEQDADIIAFIHRVERATDLDEHDKLGVDPTGLCDFIIGKQRNGPVGTCYLRFEKQYGRFSEINLADEYGITDVNEHELVQGDGSLKGQTIPAWAQNLITEGDGKGDQDENDEEEKPIKTTEVAVHAGDGQPQGTQEMFDEEDGDEPLDIEPDDDEFPF